MREERCGECGLQAMLASSRSYRSTTSEAYDEVELEMRLTGRTQWIESLPLAFLPPLGTDLQAILDVRECGDLEKPTAKRSCARLLVLRQRRIMLGTRAYELIDRLSFFYFDDVRKDRMIDQVLSNVV